MTVWIRTRKTKGGEPRYAVQYRRGGRGWRVETAGTFKVLREAKIRRDLVGGWLAQGLHPRDELAKLLRPTVVRRLDRTFDAWMLSRHDVADATRDTYEYAKRAACKFFGADRDPSTIDVRECREYVGVLARDYSPATVRIYWAPFAQALDFAEVDPNPARHHTVKKPMLARVEPAVITSAQFRLLLERTPERYRLFLRLLEATGMRGGELAKLEWGDVDFVESRFRVAARRTKTSTGQRWIQVPAPLMREVEDLVAFEDRVADSRVFRNVTRESATAAMRRACQLAGITAFSPHDLRHRRLSLWHAQGVTARELASRAGHSKASMTLDVYSHVVVDARDDEWS